jgi:hypothetical protein
MAKKKKSKKMEEKVHEKGILNKELEELKCRDIDKLSDLLIKARTEAEIVGEGELDPVASKIYDAQNELLEYDYLCKRKE